MANDYLSEIRDVNLSYLMIAQQMIRHDRAEAIFRLGISGEIADLLASMSNGQVLKMASCNVMLSRFRFNDTAILSTLLRDKAGTASAPVHASIIMASQAPETIL
ncbi:MULTISPECIES: flagellar transcriptional regulator FlhD [Oxalobacteraceae]|jgi:flagellar transcriptional activator FlhD|uniref:flagellar transcriptional regulator FlhD n=1 Tax=Oxalobacteraceae TaxID=75682 RepID=UPI0010A3FDB6|nr:MULTISPECIES: flagellar transcriptional regulator FlhD [Oxalobacteraceae]HJV80041.1 flagellar transcriptional regulator FlhD [Noviherbaspirillum sp.]